MVGGTLNLLSASPPRASLTRWRLSREKNTSDLPLSLVLGAILVMLNILTHDIMLGVTMGDWGDQEGDHTTCQAPHSDIQAQPLNVTDANGPGQETRGGFRGALVTTAELYLDFIL